MKHSAKKLFIFFGICMTLLVLIPALKFSGILNIRSQGYPPPNSIAIPVTPSPGGSGSNNLQLNTFPVIFVTFTPAPGQPTSRPIAPTAATTPVPNPTGGPIPITAPVIGGPNPGVIYCIDDQDPDMCDDNSSHLVQKGVGGAAGTCGTVIQWTHKLVDSLPQYMKGLRNSLSPAVASPSCSYTAGPHAAPDYISTYFVIDAFNLAGFHELSKTNPDNVSPSGLFNWWQSPPSGYTFIPYSPTVMQQFGAGQKDLTGCVMFLRTSSSYHIGIVNKLELYTNNGDGVISILQSGTSMYIDRFPLVNWNIENNSTNQTNTQGVAGFGCHN